MPRRRFILTLPAAAPRAAHDAVVAVLDTAALADELHERLDTGLSAGVRRSFDVRARQARGRAATLEASLVAAIDGVAGATLRVHDCWHGLEERECVEDTVYPPPPAVEVPP